MNCVYCNTKLSITNSRLQKRTNSTWRRRSCPSCGARFTSIESLQVDSVFVFLNAANDIEPFSRAKLFISIYESCRHRKVAEKDAEHLTDTVINALYTSKKNSAIQRRLIIKLTSDILHRFDPVAGTHYSAYHSL